ncbi:MAG TPA: hypothetical protein VK835_06075 [Bacteroidia bacterium]|jgi:hypothetical protein|nr:hypothetical protein [Bacteroidia bacterium]
MSTEQKPDVEISEEEKSSAPAHTLEFCLSMIKEIINQRGETPFSRKEASLILGKSESNISPKLGACGQYGILVNDRGKGYKITPLYTKIEMPTSVEEKNASMLIALNNPEVYRRLIADYNGKILPANEEMFVNLFVTNYGMIKTSAEVATKIFTKNAKALGVIDGSNRLRYLIPVANAGGSGEASPVDNKQNTPANNGGSNDAPTPQDGMVQILIPFKNGRKAYLHIPEDYSDDELTRVSKFVDALK